MNSWCGRRLSASNEELALFCDKHEHKIYFDASNLVLGKLGRKSSPASCETLCIRRKGELKSCATRLPKYRIESFTKDEANDIERSPGGR
jgi:hypothetical protein